MRNSKKAMLSVLALISLLSLTVTIAAAQGLQLQEVHTPLEKAVMGVGGEDALQSLTSLSIESGGVRWVHDEGMTVGGRDMIGPFSPAGIYVAYDGDIVHNMMVILSTRRFVHRSVSTQNWIVNCLPSPKTCHQSLTKNWLHAVQLSTNFCNPLWPAVSRVMAISATSRLPSWVQASII